MTSLGSSVRQHHNIIGCTDLASNEVDNNVKNSLYDIELHFDFWKTKYIVLIKNKCTDIRPTCMHCAHSLNRTVHVMYE